MGSQLHTYRVRLYWGIQYSTVYITAASEADAISIARRENPKVIDAFIAGKRAP